MPDNKLPENALEIATHIQNGNDVDLNTIDRVINNSDVKNEYTEIIKYFISMIRPDYTLTDEHYERLNKVHCHGQVRFNSKDDIDLALVSMGLTRIPDSKYGSGMILSDAGLMALANHRKPINPPKHIAILGHNLGNRSSYLKLDRFKDNVARYSVELGAWGISIDYSKSPPEYHHPFENTVNLSVNEISEEKYNFEWNITPSETVENEIAVVGGDPVDVFKKLLDEAYQKGVRAGATSDNEDDMPFGWGN